MLMRRSGATPSSQRWRGVRRDHHSRARRTCCAAAKGAARVGGAGDCAVSTPASLEGIPARPKRRSAPWLAAAGSSQSRSSAAFRLLPVATLAPVLRRQFRQPPPLLTGDRAQRLPQGMPQQVRRCLPPDSPPTRGLLSSAARRPRGLTPPCCCARSTVRSISRRSRSCAISARRKPTSVPLLNGTASLSRQASTSCQRRSSWLASITSSSDTPVYACRISASASWAGGIGGCPCAHSLYEGRQFRLEGRRQTAHGGAPAATQTAWHDESAAQSALPAGTRPRGAARSGAASHPPFAATTRPPLSRTRGATSSPHTIT